MADTFTSTHRWYDTWFEELVATGLTAKDAAVEVTSRYLDGKPGRPVNAATRDSAFWQSRFLRVSPVAVWTDESLVQALAKYFFQENTSNFELLVEVATLAPSSVLKAIRYSGVVGKHSCRNWSQIDALCKSLGGEFAEMWRVLMIFEQAHQDRVNELERRKGAFAAVLPFDFLIYASFYAFERWVREPQRGGDDADEQEEWDALNDLLKWVIAKADPKELNLESEGIEQAVLAHLRPVLFPISAAASAPHDLLRQFGGLIEMQVELNSFRSQSLDAFCYDDSIAFVRQGEALVLEERDDSQRGKWLRDGEKLACLHNYWFARAFENFVVSDVGQQIIGRPENHVANAQAYIKATRTHLRLTEVYGIEHSVLTDSGAPTDLFQALLSLELMSAFFARDFIDVFKMHLLQTDDVFAALCCLALRGLQTRQNRLPLTWSAREEKIRNIKGWTANAQKPEGSAEMAAAILDFWTSDWQALSERLKEGDGEARDFPALTERPVIKLGETLVQLPWLVGRQNNSTAAINNLRRLGKQRKEVAKETGRIEARLGDKFERRGFHVVYNWQFPEASEGAGEVDLICCRDEWIFVLEVKSTYIRHSQRDARAHATTTLRKAGRQLVRNSRAVTQALRSEIGFASTLRLTCEPEQARIVGWIIDTSIESDHERFDGFLKVSLEEVLIALRDDRHFLGDAKGVSNEIRPNDAFAFDWGAFGLTLYPKGFNAAEFFRIIESEAVWDCLTPAGTAAASTTHPSP